MENCFLRCILAFSNEEFILGKKKDKEAGTNELCSIENPNNLSGFSSVVINEGSASSTSFAFHGHGLSLLRKHKSLSCGVFDSCCSRRSLRMLPTLFVYHSILLFVFSVGSYSFVPASSILFIFKIYCVFTVNYFYNSRIISKTSKMVLNNLSNSPIVFSNLDVFHLCQCTDGDDDDDVTNQP